VELVALEIRTNAPAQSGKRLAEFNDPLEFLLFALCAEPRVIEVLRAPLLVDSDGLKRRTGATRDADLRPCRGMRNARIRSSVFGSFTVIPSGAWYVKPVSLVPRRRNPC
jgi:hypothetical protein